ncbi:hypothetical protein C2L71_11285 [Enteroscipio rubneri]|uniref:Uncharacterized protein n=1 Tax=Enteroscipio rubneri TaxID=2070686 RepID=A0A2K2U8W7_9ACTN|nr:hypothetical protein C2L71_11285 [Enteroscipio rubneri]
MRSDLVRPHFSAISSMWARSSGVMRMWKSAVLGFFLLMGETFRLGASGGSPATREPGLSGLPRQAGRPSRFSDPFAMRREEAGASRGSVSTGNHRKGFVSLPWATC